MNFKGNLLKKSIIVMVLLLVAGTAFAANGDTINIGGTVPLTLELTVTPDTNVDNLSLNTSNASTTADVASITVASNASAGWELYIYSANNGALVNADGDTIGYTLTYASVESTGVSDTPPTTAGVVFASEADTSGDTSGDLNMTYTQSTAYPAGYYSDQLTLVLRAQ